MRLQVKYIVRRSKSANFFDWDFSLMVDFFQTFGAHLDRGLDYALDALGKAADVIGKTVDAAAKIADAAAKHAADGLKVAGDSIPDGGSNGASAAGEKAKKLEQARRRYKEFRKVMRSMLGNSVRDKLYIMTPAYGALLAVPKESFESPVALVAFGALGVHMGIEAVEQLIEKVRGLKPLFQKLKAASRSIDRGLKTLRTKGNVTELTYAQILEQDADPTRLELYAEEHQRFAPNLSKEVNSVEPLNNEPLSLEALEKKIIDEARKKDRIMTLEITGAILGSIYDLPSDEQAEILGLFAVVMLSSYGLVDLLVRLDYAGKKLEAWEPSGKFYDKVLEKTDLLGPGGRFLQSLAHGSFVLLPWVGAIAKFATVGRVGWHVAEGAHYLPHHSLDHHPFPERLMTWGAYGFVASVGLFVTAKIAEHIVYEPLKNAVNNSATIQGWKRTAQEMFIGAKMNVVASNHLPETLPAILPRYSPMTLVHTGPQRPAIDRLPGTVDSNRFAA